MIQSKFPYTAALSLFVTVQVSAAENWPEFRGPTGQGHASSELPVSWTNKRNVKWKKELPGLGWSSPIYWEGRLYLTTAVPTRGGSQGDQSLRALAVDATMGDILWDKEVFQQPAGAGGAIHGKNSHASSTPITDGKFLYVHFGTHGTACLDLDGKVVWRNQKLRYKPVHGNGGSPAFVGDAIVVSCDGADERFVVALYRKNGKEKWRTDRRPFNGRGFSFSTPLVIRVGGKDQVVSAGSGGVSAFDPEDGTEIWHVRYGKGYSVVPRPVYGHGLVFVGSGYDKPVLYAIDPTGSGDVTDTHVRWTLKRGVPHNPSPLLVDNELYVVSDNGIARCLDAKSGSVVWQNRLGGNYSSSPIYAGGRIYFQSENGGGTVIEAGRKFRLLAKNPLSERTLASYAAGDGALFIRGKERLYRVGGETPRK